MTLRRRLTPYLFLAPALVLLGIFVVYPIIAVVGYSFTDFDIVRPPVPVGLANYREAAERPDVLAVDPALVRLPDRDADPDRALDRPRDRRQPRDARDPHLPGALLRARGERLDRHRPRLDLAVRPERVHQQRPAVVGPDQDQPIQWLANPSMVLPIAMLLTIWAGVGYYSVIFLAGPPEHPRGALRRGPHRRLQRPPEAPLREHPRAAAPDHVRGGDLEPRRAQGVRRDLRPHRRAPAGSSTRA